MKVKAVRTDIDCRSLYKNICDFEGTTNQTAYLIMNKDTAQCFEETCAKNNYWYGYHLCQQLCESMYDTIAEYCGHKIFIDNDLKFGEIEIR